MAKSIAFIVPYPLGKIGSQRFRFEQYLKKLESIRYSYFVFPFFDEQTYSNIKKTNSLKMGLYVLIGYFKRLWLLLYLKKYDFIFIHREATPIGPPLIEWILCKVMNKKIIYDFDDAIWTTDNVNENRLETILRWRSKVATICAWSYKASCGNSFLADFAKQAGAQHIIVNPTTIDTHYHASTSKPKIETDKLITIGWTGSRSTLKYLSKIEACLLELENEFQFEFLVIADKKPSFELLKFSFKKWSPTTEIDDLAKIDIGIMPLPNEDWTKGKCGFKILQYMALSIPCVASDVGANKEIINHGQNGYLIADPQDWSLYLIKLITQTELRKAIGANGRKTVYDRYSVASNTSNFLSLFE